MRTIHALTFAGCVGLAGCGVGSSDDGFPTLPPPGSVPADIVPPTEPPTDDRAHEESLSLRFGALTERSVDIDANGENATSAVAGMNEFAIDLYRAVSASEGAESNVVVSPYSVTFTLGMIYAGARGDRDRDGRGAARR